MGAKVGLVGDGVGAKVGLVGDGVGDGVGDAVGVSAEMVRLRIFAPAFVFSQGQDA